MTKLTKPVRRLSDAVVRDAGRIKQLVITIYPNDTIGLRPAKTRREERVTLREVYDFAVRQRVREEMLVKASQKKGKRYVQR